ncbi:MAG: hypothetical protein ABR542_07920 [Desulfonatronovibrio sp.]
MGELIQIRVTAKVHDQNKALKRWSTLSKIAFGQDFDQNFENRDLLSELVDALYDKDRLGQLPKNITDTFSKDIQVIHDYKKKLHAFLAERNPQEADKISYKLEDLLDKMEETAGN